jgi:acetyltransferase-like isoleucine patch superfamily enzyme
MNKLVQKILDIIAGGLSFLFSLNVIKAIRYFNNRLFSYSTERALSLVGANLRIDSDSIIINPKYMVIGKNFYAMRGLRLEVFDEYLSQRFNPILTIGDNVIMNTDCHIGCINRIRIGNNVLIASRVFIADHSHGEIDSKDLIKVPAERKLFSKGAVEIGDNVWIGEGVVILPGVKIGENCIVGANSVVTKSFSKNKVIAGIPAKMIKEL